MAVHQIKSDIQKYGKLSYDLILMDFNMPIMDGSEATKQIRDFLYENKIVQPLIIGVTGHTESEYISRALDSGMNQVLSKPLNGNKLKIILKILNKI